MIKHEFSNVVSVSGGKDSTAMYCWAIREFGASGFYPIFCDVDHEHPVTVNYVKNLHILANGPKVEIRQANFEDRLRKKGIETTGNVFLDMMLWKRRAPSTKAQFCTEHLKLNVIREYIKEIADKYGLPVVSYSGERAEESEKRAKKPREEISTYFDCMVIQPMLNWSEKQVFDFLKKCKVPPNPLYALGYSRVGCYPCIHSRKKELALLPDWAWKRLEWYEKELGRTWFPPGILPGTRGTGELTKISDVRKWCKTSHGGKQYDFFIEIEKEPPRCMSQFKICE